MSISEIKFKKNNDKTAIIACYSLHKPNILVIDKDWVTARLESSGFTNFQLITENLNQLVGIVNNAEYGSGKIQIAECCDAEVTIDIKDNMSASMTIIPAKGGHPVDLPMVKKALADQGIRHGFLLDAIRIAIVTGEANELVIVEAKPAIDGKDAEFKCVVPEIKVRTPRIAENGNVNYRDLGDITVVERGERIMYRVPATQGSPSTDIFGKIIEPIPGVDTPFAENLKGIIVDKKDPNLLIASETGQPIIVENGITIENTMSLKKVDLSTGNITFEGSIIVIGDVASGMSVQARGDITVKGMVENADLDAGGDILIRGAVIGRDDKQSGSTNIATLKAKGSITAKFTENACLKSNNNVYVQDWVIRSDINAVNEIIVGSNSSSKGQIIGGKIKSGILVKAMSFGSSAGVKTEIEVGNELDVKNGLDSVNTQIFKQEQILKEIHKKIASLKNNPTEHAKRLLEETQHAHVAVDKSIAALHLKRDELKFEKKRTVNAKLIIEKSIFSGVNVCVAGKVKEFKEDTGRRTLTVKDNELVHTFD